MIERNQIFPKIVCVVLFSAGIFGLTYSFFESFRTQQIERDGLRVSGRVTDKKDVGHEGKDGPNLSYRLAFDFAAEGRGLISEERSVSKKFFDTKNLGSPIQLIYLKETPQRLVIVGEADRGGQSLAGGMICLVLSVINFFLWFPRENRRIRRSMVSPPPSPGPLLAPTATLPSTIKIRRAGEVIGEYPRDEVPDMLRTNLLSPSDLFWHDDSAEWREVKSDWTLFEESTLNVPGKPHSNDNIRLINSFESIVDVWRSLLTDKTKSWVMFKRGTCVVLMEPETDLAAQAIAILRGNAVQAGAPSADFRILELDGRNNGPMGFLVLYDHPDILNYVGFGETDRGPFDLYTGSWGRNKRMMDEEDPEVIHLEDNRSR